SEHRLDKAGVVGSSPTRPTNLHGGLAQLGEHLLCKQGVVGSIPSSSTTAQSEFLTQALAVPRRVLASAIRRIDCRSLTIRRVENQRRRRKARSPTGAARTVPPVTT